LGDEGRGSVGSWMGAYVVVVVVVVTTLPWSEIAVKFDEQKRLKYELDVRCSIYRRLEDQ
jgi:hypothetical protein